jgi:hypothetical protein
MCRKTKGETIHICDSCRAGIRQRLNDILLEIDR